VEPARTLVLIHGLASYMPAWSRNLPDLVRNHRVIAIDLPGFGKSPKKNYKYSMEFFARVVDGLLEKLGVRDPVLVGHSMGGQISMTHALLFPRKAAALVLVAPAGLETFAEGEGRWLADASTKELFKATPPEGVYANFANNFHDMPREAQFMIDDRIRVIGGPDFDAYCYAVSRAVSAMIEGPVYDRLGHIDVPILVIYGTEDGLIPNPILHGGSTRAVAEQGVARMKRAELVMIPKAGHMVQFEEPTDVDKAILDFLARHPQAQPPAPASPAPAPASPPAPPAPAPASPPAPAPAVQ
jgi:pimeloyl-ACP methyl ester carboxylesterase